MGLLRPIGQDGKLKKKIHWDMKNEMAKQIETA